MGVECLDGVAASRDNYQELTSEEVPELRAALDDAWVACDDADRAANNLRHENANLRSKLRGMTNEKQAWELVCKSFERQLDELKPKYEELKFRMEGLEK